MRGTAPSEVTDLLADLAAGLPSAEAELFEFVYEEFRRDAATLIRFDRPGHTLSPTALVHEAFCRLRPHLETLESRRQFFAAARQVMRRILIDYARRRNSQKRSPRLFEPERPHFPDTLELWHMDMVDALAELERLDPERHAIVEYRFFFGLTMEEIAGLLSVSKSKVEKDWRVARAWLYQRLRSES